MRKIITLLLLLIFTLSAYSQSLIFGQVQDAFLKTPLPEAKVSLLLAADSTVVIDSIPIRKIKRSDGTVAKAEFSFQPEKKSCKYLLRGSLKGYEDGYQALSINGNDEGAWMLDDPLELRRVRQMNLDEVVVKATKIKMYLKGDTLVYDATAFQLPEGSMLDDLIRQMPGVTMNEFGEIFVNSRKIDELQLNSRSFMRGNAKVLMENLPYYTVKDIKVYEQNTDLNRALDAQIEKKKYVMDVNMKPEYQKGYVANVEVAGGTQKRWLGRAFLLGFTPLTCYTLLANSNNVNESRHIGSSGHWTPDAIPNSLLTTHSVAGEIDYQTLDKNVQETLTLDFASTNNDGEMIKRSELFLPLNPWQTTRQTSQAKADNLKVNNKFVYIKPKGFLFQTDASLNYNSYSGNSYTLMEQFADSLITGQRNEGFNDGRIWNANFQAKIQPNLKKLGNMKQYFLFSTNLGYNYDENQQVQRFRVEDFVSSSFTDSYNSNDYSKRELSVSVPIHYGLYSMNNVDIDVVPSYTRNNTHDWLYHPDTLMLSSQLDMLQAVTDRANSYSSELEKFGGDITLGFTRNRVLPATDKIPELLVKFFDFNLKIGSNYEKLNYQRGSLDTLAVRKTVRFEPSLGVDFYVKKDACCPVNIRIGHYEYNVSLINQIPFQDDATPLVVRLGNPDLKPWHSVTYLQAEYKDNRTARRHYNFFARCGYNHNAVSEAVSFNPVTGVYTYRPENTSGIYDIKAKAGIMHILGADRHWTVENNFDGNFVHWLDHIMLAGETESHLNAVNTLTLHDNLYIQYNKGALNVRATGDIKWRNSEGKMYDFSTLNAFDYRYGLSARYTLPRLKTTLSADGNMYSRRGYGSPDLNTDDFVLNASISQPFLKGKLIGRVEAFDILHQLSSTQYVVNAQGRTETWYRSLPHYVMFHLVYHWNRNPKKQK